MTSVRVSAASSAQMPCMPSTLCQSAHCNSSTCAPLVETVVSALALDAVPPGMHDATGAGLMPAAPLLQHSWLETRNSRARPAPVFTAHMAGHRKRSGAAGRSRHGVAEAHGARRKDMKETGASLACLEKAIRSSLFSAMMAGDHKRWGAAGQQAWQRRS